MIPEAKRYVLGAKLNSYLGNYEDAVRVLNEGIEKNPESPHLYRHRGHFKISLRRFEESIPDFEKAVELIADIDDEIEYYQAELVPEMERVLLGKGPELLDEPTQITDSTLDRLRDVYKGTLKSSTWYHYGLARYLMGDFDTAAECYKNTLPHCVDDDMRVATQDWRYMSLRRAGQETQADRLLDEIDIESMHVNEDSYLKRMGLYKGKEEPSQLLGDSSAGGHAPATKGYGVGNWYLCNGDEESAVEVFEGILEGEKTTAFGYIAAEVELERLGE